VKIGLLECDHVVGRFPQVAGGYREMVADLLGPQLQGLSFAYYDACHGEVPAPAACDAYLCTGSKYSVYDGFDWIGTLSNFIQRLDAAKKPFVGICFGHQMLAHALGGKVARAAQGWGVGVLPMTILRQEPWMRPRQATCKLQYMHQDQVQRLPEQSTVLARSGHCEVAMFRAGETMLGIEGHPEFTVPYGEALIRARAERIGAGRAQAALESLAQPTDGNVVGRWIAEFLKRSGG
jgi:GMP synthase-like glutamine amidotransferase